MAAGTIPNEIPNLVIMPEQYLIFAYDIWLTSMQFSTTRSFKSWLNSAKRYGEKDKKVYL